MTPSCFSGYSGREYGGQELDESIRPHELMYFRKYAPIYRRLAAEGHGVLRLKPEDVEYNEKLTEAVLAVKKFIKDEKTALEDRTRLNLEKSYYAQKYDTESSLAESSTLSTEHHQKIKTSKLAKNLKEKEVRIIG